MMDTEYDGPEYGPPRALPGFELHYKNMDFLAVDDVLVASIGGAGNALIGNVLLELGFRYINLATEVLLPGGASQFAPSILRHRLHGKVIAERGQPRRDAPRFLKTHLPAEEFEGSAVGHVWLLVRDPRDAIYSWYQFHRGFARFAWERVPDSFEEFLSRPFYVGVSPVENWFGFYRGWLERCAGGRALTVLRFEDLKRFPVDTIVRVLDETGTPVSRADAQRAAERSSFENMRRNEQDAVRDNHDRRPARIVRAGKVNGWTEWMTPALARRFSSPDLIEVARRFGYDLSEHAAHRVC